MKKLSIILSVILAASIILLGIVWKTTENREKRYQLEKEPFIKEVTDEDVVVTGDTAYVDCQILVNLEKISARRKLEKWIKEDGGIIVGEIPVTNTYQIEFPEGTSKDNLERIAEQLEKKKEVEIAILHYAYRYDTDEIKYDGEPWIKTHGDDPEEQFSDTSTKWNSLYPDGPNWWAEAILLSEVGNLDVQFSDINVGIIDSMFDTAHKDLEGAFKEAYQNPKNVAAQYSDAESSEDEEIKNRTGEFSHGTHVSGIIGARVNNYGISGVAPNAHLYGFALLGEDSHTYAGTIEEEYAVITLLRNNVRLINMSMSSGRVRQAVIHKRRGEGLTADTSELLSQVEKSREFSEAFYRRCEKYYDFLLFKSAGNANNIKLVKATEEEEESDLVPTCDGFREYDSNKDKGLQFEIVEGVSVEDNVYYFDDEDVRKSIIFVGAIERIDKSGKFNPADFSCVGADLMAPGSDILSDLPNDGVGYKSGTSMATPIATGTAAMIWGANPDLTAAQVREILMITSGQFLAMKDLKGIRSDTSMLNSFLAVKVAAETRNDPEYKKKPEKAAENLAVIMGTMYEETENSPSVNLDNVPDIKLTLTNDKESYQADAESLGEEGTFVFFVKPGRYKLTVDCSYYDHYETEVTAKAGDTECYALGLGREETKKRLLNEYADSLNTFYNDSYQYSGVLYRDDGNQRFEKTVEGFDAERKLGYAIDDFDDDGEYELLVLATDDNFNIIYEMYAVDGKEVSMVTREYATVDDNEHITLPASSSRGSEDCALISCFVEEQTHKIYLQISYNISAFIDGNCTYITSIRYEDGDFCDLQGITVAGSSCEYGYPGYNLDLLEMGVSFPDIKKIFEEFAPLYEYFDGGIYEICHARQRTINTENDENGWLTSVQAITLFDSQESLYKRPIEKQTTKIISEERQHELYMPVIDEYNEKMEARGPIDTVSLYTYYCFADIDGNGVEELMVNYEPKRYRSGEYNTMEIIGGRLFSIFTLVNEQPALVYGIGLSSEGMNDGFATVYPYKSVIRIETTERELYNGREIYTFKYYVFKGDKMSDMPFLIENYKYNGKTYYPEVDGIKYGLDEFDKLFLDRLDTPSKHYEMILYTKDK